MALCLGVEAWLRHPRHLLVRHPPENCLPPVYPHAQQKCAWVHCPLYQASATPCVACGLGSILPSPLLAHPCPEEGHFPDWEACYPRESVRLPSLRTWAKGSTKAVASFQSKVLDLLNAALPPLPADYRPVRPSPYNIADWDITRAPPPTRKRRVSLAID